MIQLTALAASISGHQLCTMPGAQTALATCSAARLVKQLAGPAASCIHSQLIRCGRQGREAPY
jgi:hypothetical protein